MKRVTEFSVGECICFASSRGGRCVLSGGTDGVVRVWDVESGSLSAELYGHANAISDLCFSVDGKIAIACVADGTVLGWDISSGREVLRRVVVGNRLASIASNINEEFALLGCASGDVLLQDLESGESVRTFRIHTQAVSSVDWHPPYLCFASGSVDGTVRYRCILTHEDNCDVAEHSGGVTEVALFPFSEHPVCASSGVDRLVRIVDVQSGATLTVLAGFDDTVTSVAWVSEEVVVTGSLDGTVKLWTISRESSELVAVKHGEPVLKVSAQGDVVLSVSVHGVVSAWSILG